MAKSLKRNFSKSLRKKFRNKQFNKKSVRKNRSKKKHVLKKHNRMRGGYLWMNQTMNYEKDDILDTFIGLKRGHFPNPSWKKRLFNIIKKMMLK